MKIKKHKSCINLKSLKKANENKEKIINKITEFLEMPEEIKKNSVKVTVVDNKYFYLEGTNQIMDYFNHYIKIKTNRNIITLDGKNMEIKDISSMELVIQGEIFNISYNK